VSRFIPSLDDITAGRVRPETHVGFEQTANIDLAGLEVPTLEDEGELCDEVLRSHDRHERPDGADAGRQRAGNPGSLVGSPPSPSSA